MNCRNCPHHYHTDTGEYCVIRGQWRLVDSPDTLHQCPETKQGNDDVRKKELHRRVLLAATRRVNYPVNPDAIHRIAYSLKVSYSDVRHALNRLGFVAHRVEFDGEQLEVFRWE